MDIIGLCPRKLLISRQIHVNLIIILIVSDTVAVSGAVDYELAPVLWESCPYLFLFSVCYINNFESN